MPPDKKINAKDAMMMNRKERKRLGKQNGVKIPGIIKPYRKSDWIDDKKADIL